MFCCRRQRVEQIITAIGEVGGLEQYAYLFLLAYAFLLRLPSEALPVKVGPCDGPATLTLVGDKLVLKLARRCQTSHTFACPVNVVCMQCQEEQATGQRART